MFNQIKKLNLIGKMQSFDLLLNLQHNNIIQVSGILFRNVFSLQLPPLFISLDSDTDFVVSVLPIDFIKIAEVGRLYQYGEL